MLNPDLLNHCLGYNSYEMALNNMDNAMAHWDGQGYIAADLDFLQNYYQCCGSLTYTDWENLERFESYATVRIDQTYPI